MNEVYSEADQQDGRGTGKEQLSSTWDGQCLFYYITCTFSINNNNNNEWNICLLVAEKSKEDSSTKRLAANKQASTKTQLAVGGRSVSSAAASQTWSAVIIGLLPAVTLLVSMTKTRQCYTHYYTPCYGVM